MPEANLGSLSSSQTSYFVFSYAVGDKSAVAVAYAPNCTISLGMDFGVICSSSGKESASYRISPPFEIHVAETLAEALSISVKVYTSLLQDKRLSSSPFVIP